MLHIFVLGYRVIFILFAWTVKMQPQLDRLKDTRILIYSHDSFGLGHLRRCRAIAHSLVDTYKGMSVMIISGSPVISQFDFRARVSFITVPGIVKLRNGDYTSLGLHVDLGETLAMRSSMIQHTAEAFSPDIFLVDKEPLGLRGEVENTLRWLKMKGTTNILGLRDVMDESEALQTEWKRKEAVPAIEKLYDEIWIYGSPDTGNPVQGIDLSKESMAKMHYLGYLKRQQPSKGYLPKKFRGISYILVTPGGGGDGEMLVDWVIRAYELNQDGGPGNRALEHCVIVLGPFMSVEAQREFRRRARKLKKLDILVFDSHIEVLMENAIGIVAMGGYNTFCEILSFDKRAILVPRETPRLEQRIRADYAEKQGLVSKLLYEDQEDTSLMIEMLLQLPKQPLPSNHGAQLLLNGLENINQRVQKILDNH